ncbi:MAG: Diamine N-acetyltransferase [Bacteroidota bacterium]|jgi:GNAT superfamily N-acetyltransferase
MIELRRAKQEDIPSILELVNSLALFEKAPDEVTATAKDYMENGFGENPIFFSFLAYHGGQLAGFALWYFRFSTWKGKRLYLEDLYVKDEFRGKGIGQKLIEACIEEAKQTKCTGMMWQVLEWNTRAIDFYKKYNAQFDGEWINVNLHL